MAALDAIRVAKIKRNAFLCMESKCFHITVVPCCGETDWRIRSTGPQDSFSVVADGRTASRAKTHRRRSWSHPEGPPDVELFKARRM